MKSPRMEQDQKSQNKRKWTVQNFANANEPTRAMFVSEINL